MTILITRPRFDPGTNYLYYWSEPVINLARKKNIKIIDIKNQKAKGKIIFNYLKKIKPSLLFLNGHGSESTITGQDLDILISTSDDLTIFQGCIFYCRSCNCATTLGPSLIGAGTKGLIGYKRKFCFASLPENTTHPLKDILAQNFLDPSNLVPSSLLKGHSLGIAYKKSQSAMKANLRKMLSSTAMYEEKYYSQYLWSNIKSQTVLGNLDSKL